MARERWRDISGWEGYYQASNLGRIRSVDRVVRHNYGGLKRLKGRILSLSPLSHAGHLGLKLCKKGVTRSKQVHRLVAATWIGPCPDGQEVRHGPNGKLDNSVANLSYGTRSENGLDMRRDGTHGGRAVRRSDGAEFINMTVAAEESGCCVQNIHKVCNGRRNTTGGYCWEYIENPKTPLDFHRKCDRLVVFDKRRTPSAKSDQAPPQP